MKVELTKVQIINLVSSHIFSAMNKLNESAGLMNEARSMTPSSQHVLDAHVELTYAIFLIEELMREMDLLEADSNVLDKLIEPRMEELGNNDELV